MSFTVTGLLLTLCLATASNLMQTATAQTFSIHPIDSSSLCFGPKPVFTPGGDSIVVLDCANRMYLWPRRGERTNYSPGRNHLQLTFDARPAGSYRLVFRGASGSVSSAITIVH